jgi:hypothetical protein
MVSSDQLEYAIANSEIIQNIQSRLDDMERLLRLQQSVSIADHSPLPPSPSLPPNQETVETDSTIELDKGAIGPVRGDSDSIDTEPSEAVDIENRQGLTNDQLSKKIGIPTSTIEKWKGKIREGKEITSTKYPKFFKQWTLNLADSLWYEV